MSQTVRSVVVSLLVFLVVIGLAAVHFRRNLAPTPTHAGMDLIQAARITARTRHLSTQIVRPLLTLYTASNADGTLPDMGHAPLYPTFLALLLRVSHHAASGMGDREAALLSLSLFLLTVAACYACARRWFGEIGAALPAAFLCALGGGGGLAYALEPHPATLAALLFTLFIGVLYRLDSESSRRIPLALAGGALFGLLYLTLYSTLLILPVVFWYVWHITRRDMRLFLAFGLAAFLVAIPWLVRNQRLAHNPFFHSRLLELVMNTTTYPGDGLYRATGLPRSVGAYLSEGGVAEVIAKTAHNLLGLCEKLPQTVGLLVLPLFLLSALTRFADDRINRLRNLGFGCLACHVVGLSCFFAPDESAPIFWMYAPLAAIIGVAFLLGVVRARNLLAFYERATLAGWLCVACLPGVCRLVAGHPTAPPTYDLYDSLNQSPKNMAPVRVGAGHFIADDPWQVAFRCDAPAVWLPNDSGALLTISERTGRPFVGIALSPALLLDYSGDSASLPWRETNEQIIALFDTVRGLDAQTRENVIQQKRLFYPPSLSTALTGFRPVPLPERSGTRSTLVFWPRSASPSGAQGR